MPLLFRLGKKKSSVGSSDKASLIPPSPQSPGILHSPEVPQSPGVPQPPGVPQSPGVISSDQRQRNQSLSRSITTPMDSSKKQVEDFSDLFYRPKPRQVGLQGDSCNKLNHPSMRDDTQPQPPTPNPPADASGASTEELLQTLNLLSLQCAQFSNSILEMMDLHVTKVQKLIGELRENVIAERENCATL